MFDTEPIFRYRCRYDPILSIPMFDTDRIFSILRFDTHPTFSILIARWLSLLAAAAAAAVAAAAVRGQVRVWGLAAAARVGVAHARRTLWEGAA